MLEFIVVFRLIWVYSVSAQWLDSMYDARASPATQAQQAAQPSAPGQEINQFVIFLHFSKTILKFLLYKIFENIELFQKIISFLLTSAFGIS